MLNRATRRAFVICALSSALFLPVAGCSDDTTNKSDGGSDSAGQTGGTGGGTGRRGGGGATGGTGGGTGGSTGGTGGSSGIGGTTGGTGSRVGSLGTAGPTGGTCGSSTGCYRWGQPTKLPCDNPNWRSPRVKTKPSGIPQDYQWLPYHFFPTVLAPAFVEPLRNPEMHTPSIALCVLPPRDTLIEQ